MDAQQIRRCCARLIGPVQWRRTSKCLDPPVSGRITFAISTPTDTVVETVSHIYPSLTQLCSVLCDLAERNQAAQVLFLLEPLELELRIIPKGDGESELRLAILSRSVGGPRSDAVLNYTSETPDLVLIFWRALRRLQTSLTPERFEQEWREPFPQLEMMALTRLLKP